MCEINLSMKPQPPTTPTVEHIDFEALESFRFEDGMGFPQSYQNFVKTYGWARSFGMWLIYPPVRTGFADGRARAQNLSEHFQVVYLVGQEEGFDWMVEPDGDWQIATRLEVFGWSENGDFLLWDTSSRAANGEFPVWESRGLNSLHRIGSSLDEACAALNERSGLATIDPLQAHKI